MPTQTKDTMADVTLRQGLRSNVIKIMSKYKDPGFARFYLYQQGYNPEDIDQEINQINGFSQTGGFQAQGGDTGTSGVTGSYAGDIRSKIQELPAGQQEGAFSAIAAAEGARNLASMLDKGVSTGPVSGRAQKFSARFLNRASKEFIDFNSASTAFTANFIKAISGVQVSDKERQFLMNALPSPEKQELENRQGMEQLVKFLKDKYEIQLGVPLDIEKIYGTGEQTNQDKSGNSDEFKGALDWASKNPDNPTAQKFMKKIQSGEIDMLTGEKKNQEQINKTQEGGTTKNKEVSSGDWLDKAGKIGNAIGEFLGGNKIGQAIGNIAGGKLAEHGEAGKAFAKTIAQIEQLYQEGKIDEKRKDEMLQIQEKAAKDAFGYSGPSFGQVAADIGQVALTFVPGAGIAGKTAKGISKIPLIGKGAGFLSKVATGAGIGYGYDVIGNMKEGKEINESMKPDMGTAIGASIPVVGKAFQLAGKGLGALSRTLSGTPKKAFEYVVNNPDVLNEKLSSGSTAGDDLISLVNKVKSGFSEVYKKKNTVYKKALQEINTKYQGKTISNNGLMDGVKNVLSEFDTLDAMPAKNQKIVNQAIDLINKQSDFSPRGYDKLRMGIRYLIKGGTGQADRTTDTVLGKIANQVKSHLETNVPEIKAMNTKYTNAMDVIDNLIKDLKPEGDKKALINRLIKVFDDNSPFQREAVELLGEKKAKEIYDMVARKIFKEWIPIGGIGRVLTSLGVGGAALGTATGGAGVLPAAAGVYSMGSPKLVGKAASLIGKAKRFIKGQGINQMPGDVFWKSKAGKSMLEHMKSTNVGMTIKVSDKAKLRQLQETYDGLARAWDSAASKKTRNNIAKNMDNILKKIQRLK